MGLSLIPTSLPLAVLLASLITFGNMGEDLELLSMKAAGVSLLRVMRPVMLTAMLITGLSFYVQNKTAPEATISMRTLLISMKQMYAPGSVSGHSTLSPGTLCRRDGFVLFHPAHRHSLFAQQH